MGFKRQADPQDVEEIPDDEPEARVHRHGSECLGLGAGGFGGFLKGESPLKIAQNHPSHCLRL